MPKKGSCRIFYVGFWPLNLAHIFVNPAYTLSESRGGWFKSDIQMDGCRRMTNIVSNQGGNLVKLQNPKARFVY